MSAAPLRLGIVGCGRLAEHGYLPAIAGADGAEVVALADPVRARCELVASLCGSAPSLHADVEDLTADQRVEAVIVASPPGEHLAAATAAATAGLTCLVEKPPGPDARSARELATLSPAPWIGFNRRFQQGLELIDRIPGRGELELELELRYRRASWQAHVVRDDALLDLAPHLIDLALLLGGGPGGVVSAAASPERADLVLELERGTARIRCATDRAHLERIGRARRRGRDRRQSPRRRDGHEPRPACVAAIIRWWRHCAARSRRSPPPCAAVTPACWPPPTTACE